MKLWKSSHYTGWQIDGVEKKRYQNTQPGNVVCQNLNMYSQFCQSQIIHTFTSSEIKVWLWHHFHKCNCHSDNFHAKNVSLSDRRPWHPTFYKSWDTHTHRQVKLLVQQQPCNDALTEIGYQMRIPMSRGCGWGFEHDAKLLLGLSILKNMYLHKWNMVWAYKKKHFIQDI